jgi:hypothetical protein
MLGYRCVTLDLLQDHMSAEYSLPHTFSIACGTSANEAKAVEIAERLIDKAPFEEPEVGALSGDSSPGAARRLREFFAGQIANVRAPHVTATISEAGELPPEAMLPTLSSDYETAPFTPDFWNEPAHLSKNNCYAYAANRRTDTFPQPGRSTQREAASFTAGEIAEAAMSDGVVSADDTVDASDAPRYLAALFIWPGRDYHWYRLHADRPWGHKPGPKLAETRDCAGMWIRDPRVCSRGDYADFCGFFLMPKSCTLK